jgi:hypothetical protein
MKIDKVNGTFNTYKLEVSFGELTAVANALEDTVGAPVADEMRAGIRWYLDHLPGPGEDKEEFKAKKEAETELKTMSPELGAAPETETGGPPALAAEITGPDMEPAPEADKELPEPPQD